MRQFRLVHVGVAAVLAAATVAGVGLVQSVTAATGSPSSFVPITPCRLVDTRPGSIHVGTRATPIGANEAVTFAVWGTNGNCTIPATATGIATNTTAVNPTASSFLTVYPADASPRPAASNLNTVAGAAPTPNQVTVGLSATGAIDVYNLTGTVDVIVDIVGYYQAASSSGGSSGSHSKQFSAIGFLPYSDTYSYTVGPDGITDPVGIECFYRPVDLPDGAVVTLLSTLVYDASTVYGVSVKLIAVPFDPSGLVNMVEVDTSNAFNGGNVSGGNNLITQPTINNAGRSYALDVCLGSGTRFLGAAIDYTVP
jgi:hypothetical protein